MTLARMFNVSANALAALVRQTKKVHSMPRPSSEVNVSCAGKGEPSVPVPPLELPIRPS
jgi:hypothetical protein